MAVASATNRSKRSKAYRANQKRLAKARAGTMNAKQNVAIAVRQLTAAVRNLIRVQAGSSQEVRAAKVARAATKDLVITRKKLRKAEKKRKKALVRAHKASPRPNRDERARHRARRRSQRHR
jgi:hypothetical protein